MLFPCSLFRASAALLALGALPLSAAEQPDPAQARPVVSITDLNPVRLTRDAHSKLLVAQCTINGVPCNLIVDTAASHTTFDIKFIKKNFPGLPLENAQIAPGSNVNTVPQLFAMKSFSIGGLHIKNFFGLAMDLTPFKKICRSGWTAFWESTTWASPRSCCPSGMLPSNFWNAPAFPPRT
ncbi:retropepsin-like aspartic protease [Akkermansia massiliensis]